MNLGDVFLRPRQAVKAALARPSLGTIIGLNIAPSLLNTIIFMALGLGFSLIGLVLGIANTFITIIVLSALIYLFALLFKSKLSPKGRFLGIMQACSIVWVFALVVTLIAGLLFAATPGLLGPMQERAKGIVTTEKLAEKLTQTIAPNQAFLTFGLALLLTLIWFIYTLVVWFMASEEVMGFTRLKSIGVFALLLIVMYFIMAFKLTLF